jgi:hypothetical protein
LVVKQKILFPEKKREEKTKEEKETKEKKKKRKGKRKGLFFVFLF